MSTETLIERILNIRVRYTTAAIQLFVAFATTLQGSDRSTGGFLYRELNLPVEITSLLLLVGVATLLIKRDQLGFYLGILPMAIYILASGWFSYSHQSYNPAAIYVWAYIMMLQHYWCNGEDNGL